MQSKRHGLISLSLIGIAIFIAAFIAATLNILLMAGFLLFSVLAFVVIIFTYCAKCACKHHCPHLIPGKIAKTINRLPGPYSKIELIILGIALCVLLLLPNIWLRQNINALILYWVLVILAIIEIRKYVCKPCGNINCPLNQKNEL
jgi:hypothetical protein